KVVIATLLPKLVEHGLWHRVRLELAVRVAHDPNPFFGTLDARFAIQTQLVLDLEARTAEGDRALHRHVVAKASWLEKTRTCAHQRIAGEIQLLELLEFGESGGALKQHGG